MYQDWYQFTQIICHRTTQTISFPPYSPSTETFIMQHNEL